VNKDLVIVNIKLHLSECKTNYGDATSVEEAVPLLQEEEIAPKIPLSKSHELKMKYLLYKYFQH